jgi:ABC-type multidrug transport system fused ATPase/permease subunit
MSLQPVSSNTQYPAMPFTQAITLNNIVYRYPNAATPALKDISFTIPAKSTVGLVGATGSGKTTTVDLILGLLDAQEGTLAIDGQMITENNKRAWQRAIGYVPQQIYLADDTVAANIAFGIEPEQIDQVAVERAAKIANLHEFVTSDLPQGYATTVGERGVRLSGGQRQRIGIARALYHNPQVLILDEATSALDNLTEQAVMEAVHNLGHDITIILIAHRLSTVKECDQIFLLEKGELKGRGRFEDLTRASERFRAMADLN